jgi:hypothetical protein
MRIDLINVFFVVYIFSETFFCRICFFGNRDVKVFVSETFFFAKQEFHLLRAVRRSLHSSHDTSFLCSCSCRRASGVPTAAIRAQGERDADSRTHVHGHVLTGKRGERLQVPAVSTG